MAYRNHRNAATSSRPSIYQTVTDRILSSLKRGVIPWEKPWKSPSSAARLKKRRRQRKKKPGRLRSSPSSLQQERQLALPGSEHKR